MRYTSDHKQKTHERIVAEASRLFREEGYKGSSVDAVMQAAELTPGGFYAHFEDKDSLLAEVVGAVHTAQRAAARGRRTAWPRRVRRVDRLLPWPRPFAAAGPRLHAAVAYGGDRAAAEKGAQGVYRSAARAAGRIDAPAPGETEAQRDERAIATLASLVGAVMLARAVDDKELAGRILGTVRGAISKQIGDEPQAAHKPEA